MKRILLVLTIVATAMAALATIPSEMPKQPDPMPLKQDVPWRLTNDGWVAATWLERAKLVAYQPSPMIYFHPAALAALILLVSAGSLVLFERQDAKRKKEKAQPQRARGA